MTIQQSARQELATKALRLYQAAGDAIEAAERLAAECGHDAEAERCLRHLRDAIEDAISDVVIPLTEIEVWELAGQDEAATDSPQPTPEDDQR